MPKADAERIRFLVYTTVFGALWGLLEMLLGSWLHMIQFPFRGALMAGIGSVLLCVARLYAGRPGATLATGGVAVAIKLFSIGAFKLGPVAGILIESALVEAVFSAFGRGNVQFVAAGLAACLEGIPHFFVTNWILYGRGIFDTYLEAARQMQAFFGLPQGFLWAILAAWLAGHLFLGLLSGTAAILVARQLKGP